MTSTSGPPHRSVSSIRPTPSTNASSIGNPKTPLRPISSAYGSPSALRAEEDCIILELGCRFLRAGLAGDAVPPAVINFGPAEQLRAGDYRIWRADYDSSWEERIQGDSWGEQHELWKLDLRDLDLGLVGDKIERATRDAFTKYLLVDSRPRRVALVLPSTLPRPLLSTILDTLFTNFQPPSISLMAAPVLTAVAAGLRSAHVVDIGWTETVVTSVYEYREVQSRRSIRGTKFLGDEMAKMLSRAVEGNSQGLPEARPKQEYKQLISFEEVEDIVARMAWCRPARKQKAEGPTEGLAPVKEEDELRSSVALFTIQAGHEDEITMKIPLASTASPITLRIPQSKLSQPCETALFADGTPAQEIDDEELPLHLLLYRSLLQLPVDVRSMCMSRIIFVGGGSRLLGLKDRLLAEVENLIEQRGWDPVEGKAVQQLCNNQKLFKTRSRQASTGPTAINQTPSTIGTISAGLVEQESDPVEEQLRRAAAKGIPPHEHGHLRAVESLGAWSGASILSQLKVPSVSIIDRDQWLQYGAAGASRSSDVSAGAQRQSMGPGALKAGGADRSSWTLGLWA